MAAHNTHDAFFKNRPKDSSSTITKPTEPKRQKGRRGIIRTIVVWVVIIALAAAAGYFYWQYREVKDNPESAAEKETAELLSDVGKIIELPEGEEPTIATVTDRDQLDDQDFFKNAENGDKILVYGTYKMVILYRPSTNKIIKVAPLVLGDTTSGTNTNTGSTNTNSTNTNS